MDIGTKSKKFTRTGKYSGTQAPMHEQNPELFIAEACHRFTFLSNQFGFTGPTITTDEPSGCASVAFVGKHVAVVCVLDLREENVDCYIARIRNGGYSLFPDFDETGARVSELVFSHIRRRQTGKAMFRNVGKLELQDKIPIVLEDYAVMLKDSGYDILSDSTSVLD